MEQTAIVQTPLITEENSKRISVLRFPLVMLVVLGHNTLVKGNDEKIGIVYQINFLVECIQFLFTTCFAHCVVPLFFIFAAYLLAKKNYSYSLLLKKKIHALLIPYILWLSIDSAFSIAALPDVSALDLKPADWATLFLGHQEWFKPTVIPIAENTMASIQFWYLRDLMIMTFLAPLFIRLIKKLPVIVLAITFLAYLVSFEVQFVKNETIFFFLLGLYFGIYEVDFFEKVDRIKWVESMFLLLITCIATFRAENRIVLNNFMIMSGCIFLLKLSKLVLLNEKLTSVLSYLSGFSFFLYAVHLPILGSIIMILWVHFLPMKTPFLCLFEYFGAALLISALGTGIGIALKKLCPPVFALFNGGRK